MTELDHVAEYCRALGLEDRAQWAGGFVASGGLCAPTGTFIHLVAGTLELGVVRDSVVNGKTDFIFAETFE